MLFYEIKTSRLYEIFVYKHKNQQNMLKVAYFLRKIQTLRVNNSIILRIKNVKISGYLFSDEPEHTMKLTAFCIFHTCLGQKLSLESFQF